MCLWSFSLEIEGREGDIHCVLMSLIYSIETVSQKNLKTTNKSPPFSIIFLDQLKLMT